MMNLKVVFTFQKKQFIQGKINLPLFSLGRKLQKCNILTIDILFKLCYNINKERRDKSYGEEYLSTIRPIF